MQLPTRHLDARVQETLTQQFVVTVNRAHTALGSKAFRPQRAMNVAVYDAMMVAILECPDAGAHCIRHSYKSLIADERFMKMSSDATSDEPNVHGRIDFAKAQMNAAT